ncbi:MAG: Tn3 family transposase [Acidobacteria bacterium]|nr:Tn3 family transposase [Acidobacteriota bacterium]
MKQVVQFPVLQSTPRHTRVGFETVPANLSRAELFRYFTFPEPDRREIAQCRSESNKIGFALLLGAIRLTGRFIQDFELVPHSLVAHICEQLRLETPLILTYPQRQPTRYEHVERIKSYLGLRSFKQPDNDVVVSHVRERVRAGARLHELLADVEEMLRERKIVLPGVTVLERLIGHARVEAEDELFREISERVDEQAKVRILALLKVREGEKITPFQQLQQAAGRPSPTAFNREVDALGQVRAILPDDLNLEDLDGQLLERLAQMVSGLPTQALVQFQESKRVGLLLIWLWRLRTRLIDTALTISHDLIAGVLRRAKNAAAKAQQKQNKRIAPVLGVCGEVVEMLLDESIADDNLRGTIFEKFSRQQLESLPAECRALAIPTGQLYFQEVRQRYGYLRQFAPRLLEAFTIKATTPSEPLLNAVEYLRDRNEEGQRGIDADAPLDFVPPSWTPYVCPNEDEIDRQMWEICLLDQVRQALKGGNLHVPHSRAFQPLEQYLIGRQEWELEKAALAEEHQLPLDFQTHWTKVTALHKEQLRRLDESFPSNDALRIEGEQFHLTRAEQLVVSPTAKELKEQIRKRLNRRQLSDLLLETHAWTGFLKSFTRLTTGRPITDADASDQVALLACLIAEGCNIGLRDMAVNNPGLNFDLMDEVKASYVREETLAKATATLVNFQLQQPLAESWGQGDSSSSDARVYGVPVRALNATFNPKYFASAGRGINVYTHVADTWVPFYTQVITCNVRQAPYVLDGLLYHGTHLQPREHYTDTHGYTDLIFGAAHLLGIRFAPRIKDLPEQRLWRLPGDDAYTHIDCALSDKLNVNLIRETWDEIVRLMASIRNGKVRASLILSKLSAASKRNRLFRGLQEFGRLIKTAYLAEYLRSEELRRRVLLGLNKGESLNSLARKLFYGGQGEIRDRTYEDQLNAASSLNLLLAVIVVWNTVHIQACLRRLKADGRPVEENDLKHLSPLLRDHIAIYGQYSFDLKRYESVPAAETFTY